MITLKIVNNNFLEYLVLGNSPNQIYLFNGYGSLLDSWSKEFIYNLTEHFQVIIFNYPGFGMSRINKKVESFNDYSYFFSIIFSETYKGGNFNLFGFSMGGYVLRNVLINLKKIRPNKVIFCSSSFGGMYRVRASNLVMKMLKKEGIDKTRLLFRDKNMTQEKYISLMLYPSFKNISQLQYDSQSALIQNFFETNCENISQNMIGYDCFIIHGKNDVIFPKKNAKIIKKFCIKNSKLFLIEGGHGILFEKYKVICEKIFDYCL